VWQDLHTHGFRNDLQRGRSNADFDMLDLSSQPPLHLPPKSLVALQLLSFYLPMYEVLPQETSGILARVCQDNPDVSRYIIITVLTEVQTCLSTLSMAAQHMLPPLETLQLMLAVILGISDRCFSQRCEMVFRGEVGLLAAAVEKAKLLQQHQQHHHHLHDYQMVQHSQQISHYIQCIRELMQKNPSVRAYVESRKEEVEHLMRFQRYHSVEGPPSHGGMGGYHSPSKRTGESEDDSDYFRHGPSVVRPPHTRSRIVMHPARHKA
jgi:flagellar biosynthesis regulator FlbT